MTRMICLDTETTGLEVKEGHRIIEIGCVEIIDREVTNRHFHVYLNPMRLVDEEAMQVHGLTNEFLQDKPHFSDVYRDFLDFIQDSTLIIHNAPFDLGFLNAECGKIGARADKIEDRCQVIDTLKLAKQKHRGQKNNLDALCKRYGIDNGHRTLHGALLDSEILAEVYLAMTGGQMNLFGAAEKGESTLAAMPEVQGGDSVNNRQREGIIYYANDVEKASHEKFLEMLKKDEG